MRAGAFALCIHLLCVLTARSTESRQRDRLRAQDDSNSKLIQNIKEKLIVDNEDYVTESQGFPEDGFNFAVDATKVEIDAPDRNEAKFEIDAPKRNQTPFEIDEPERNQAKFKIDEPQRNQPEPSKTQLESNFAQPESNVAHFESDIVQTAALESAVHEINEARDTMNPEKPESASDGKTRETTRRESNPDLRIKQKSTASQSVPSTIGEAWTPYTIENEKRKRAKFQRTRKDDPAAYQKYFHDPEVTEPSARGYQWTTEYEGALHYSTAGASSIVVYNFYPISQGKRAGNKENMVRTGPGIRWSHPGELKASAPSRVRWPGESTARPRGAGYRAEQRSGVVTFKYRAEIPLQVPLSRRWISNAFTM